MMAGLANCARPVVVMAFFAALAWIFGVYPPAWGRLLIVASAVGAIYAEHKLNPYLTRVARVATRHFEPAA